MTLRNLLLLIAIFGSIAIAVLRPEVGEPFQPYLTLLMMGLLFLSFLRIDFDALLDTSWKGLLGLSALAVVKLVLLPLVLYAVAWALIPEYAIAVLLLSGVSTGVVAPFIAGLLAADLAPVIRMVIITSVLVPFSLPCLVKVLAGAEITIPLDAMMRLLAYVIFIPMALVLILRKTVPSLLAPIAAVQFWLSVILISVVNLGVFSKYSTFFFQEPRQILISAALAYVLSIIYYGTGFVLTPRSTVAERLSSAVSMAMMNNVLVIVFAAGFFGPLPPTLAAMYMLPYYTMIVPVKMLARHAQTRDRRKWPHEPHTIYEVTLKSCKTSCLLLAAVLLVPLMASCSSKSSASLHRSSRLLLGTLIEVTIPGDRDKAASATQAVFDEMKRIEDLTSFHKQSGLAAINDAAGTGPVKADAELLGLIGTALDTSQKTKGAFDPSVGVLSRLWSFSGGEPRLPEQAEIADALTKVGAQRIQIDRSAGTVSLPEKGMALDLGGIAKGYALDRSAKVLKEHGITSALVNAGGDVLVLGEKEPGKPWRVGVQDPRNPREVAAVVSVKDKVIMTSGDYERFFVKDGKRYHHILDPKTGYPAEGAESVTLVANSGVRAEPLGATVFVKGVTDGLAYVESLGGVEAMVIDPKGQVHMTPGASEVFRLKK